MNYTSIKEEGTNFAQIAGVVVSIPEKSHEVEGEKFFEFMVEINRLSESKDFVPVTISERTLLGQDIKVGSFVKIIGEYRSYNRLSGEKSKLVLHLFAKEISFSEDKNFENDVRLVGFLCKEPVYRKTPFNREICDILLAVNRTNYHKSDYVPCILWGRNARFMANQKVGCKVEIFGRIQSRNYTKALENGEIETKTAYEVSCQRIAILSSIASLNGSTEVLGGDVINN